MQPMALRIARGGVLALFLFAAAQAVGADAPKEGLAVTPECATGPGSTIWKRQFPTGSSGMEEVYVSGAATDGEGNIIVGYGAEMVFNIPHNQSKSSVAKYSSTGEPLWRREIGADRSAGPVATDSVGNIVASGSLGQLGNMGLWLAKHNSVGDLLWAREMRTGEGYIDKPSGITTDADGNALISATTYPCTGSFCDLSVYSEGIAWVAKYSPAGEPLWWRRIGVWSSSLTTSLIADSNGSVIVSGRASDYSHEHGVTWAVDWIVQMSPSGDLVWWRVPDADFAPWPVDLWAGDFRLIGFDPVGNIVGGGVGYEYGWGWIVKYSPLGEPLSLRPLPEPSREHNGQPLALDGDGNILAVGSQSFSMAPFVAKHGVDGSLHWSRAFHRLIDRDRLNAVTAADRDGHVVVSGITCCTTGQYAIWINKLRP